jgi:protein-S-isoprenylcysteine O-methyltransferase Ste14
MEHRAVAAKMKLVARIVIELAVPLSLFLGAGTVVWLEAWVLLAIFYLLTGAVWWMLAVKNPDLWRERMSSINQEDQPIWDKTLMALIGILMLAWMVLMGIDAVRFRWSHVPLPLQLLGLAGSVASSLLMFWTFYENSYLAAVVKIQDEGHQVVSTGPYAHVRHPLYASVIPVLPSVALLLGSWWGLITSPVLILLYVLRTSLEDQKLQRELKGYLEYSQKVRYRLIPGIW